MADFVINVPIRKLIRSESLTSPFDDFTIDPRLVISIPWNTSGQHPDGETRSVAPN
jgi:hypothetical protein